MFVHVALSTKTSIVIWLCGEALPTPQSPFPLSRPPPAFFVPGSKNKYSISKEKSLSKTRNLCNWYFFWILWMDLFLFDPEYFFGSLTHILRPFVDWRCFLLDAVSRHFSEADVKNKRQTRTKGNDRKQTGKQGNKENQGKTKDNFCKSSTRWGKCWKANEKLRKTNGKQQKNEENEGKPMKNQWKPMENK